MSTDTAHVGSARIARPKGESKQDYCTPREFLDAVERRFGSIVWDLAATREQSVTRHLSPVRFYGPDHLHPEHRNALLTDWSAIDTGLRWLNPPFAHIAPWVERCARWAKSDSPIALLVPASIGANWYWQHVAPNARTYSVGRMMFVERHADGSETPACFDKHGRPTNYNKDLMLCVFSGRGTHHGLERWQWQKDCA